ncbi:MAG: CpaF family protein [Candidatus Omnitrophota bacterium]
MVVKELKDKIRKALFSASSNLFSREEFREEDLKEAIRRATSEVISLEAAVVSEPDKARVASELFDELTGFGPLEGLIKDPEVTEIMINGPKKIYVEKAGKSRLSGLTFDDESRLMFFIYKILSPTRRHVDEYIPYTDVSMEDGSRVNIIISPLALDGPVVTIRKFLKNIASADDLISLGTIDRRMADFLVACVKARVNIIFTGATGSGKTTTLNALSSYIADGERIVTIEDTAELRLSQEHVVRLESRQPNIEGKGEVGLRELFRNSLRMRPKRIILGEIRGAEALDMLQAICSGHAGSLAILHANSPQDAIYRLETMILTSGVPLTLEAINRQIAAAVNLIVQHEQMPDGSRKITYITQVNGLKNGQVALEDIFLYESAEGAGNGSWKATGVVPVFYPLFKKAGLNLSADLFRKD